MDLEKGRRALLGGSVGASSPFTVAKALGSEIWDTSGKRYIDCTAQAWSLSVGHSHPRIVAAVSEHLKSYGHIRTSFDTEPKLLLAKKLAEIAPGRLKKVAFCLSGSEAMEGAMKLAMRNSEYKSQTFVSLYDGFHGRTLGTMSLSWPHPKSPFSQWQGPVVRVPQAYCYRCPVHMKFPSCQFECVRVARNSMYANLSSRPAGLVMEPVQGNGGMIAFPPGYLKRMRELADDFGTLLIFDEIQTGFGRVGEWFASILYEVQPDIMVIGKGLGGGFPLFGTMMDHELQGFQAGDHSFTFAHFSPSMVAALETIKIIEEENLLMRVNVLGTAVQMRLLDMQKKYEFIGDVRGVGLMIGIELVVDRISKCPAPKLTHRIVERALQRGVILGDSKYGGLGNVLKFKPPLNIPEDLAMDALDVLDEIFSTVHEGEIE